MKKTGITRIFAFAISILMMISVLPAGIFAAQEVPAGTAVTTAEEFSAMKADGNYYLANDITLNATYANEFSGTFDGNGKTITTSCTVFDKVTNGTVKNFTVQAAGTKIALLSGGAAVCNTAFGATFRDITNCAALESTDGENNHGLAAIVGSVAGNTSDESTVTIEGCVNKGDIKGHSKRAHAAGIIGFVRFTNKESVNLVITDCRNEGNVDAAKAGGIACYAEGVKGITITGCSNSGNLISYNLSGGIIAQVSKTCTTLTVEDCINAGNLSGTGNKYNGGIVGICQIVGDAFDCTGRIAFRRCVNSGAVTGAGESSHGGGIVGRHYGALIEYCGNTGLIEHSAAAGGIVGHTENANITRYCYNLGMVKGTVYSAGIVAVTKVPLDRVYGCYNAGQITMDDGFDEIKYNMAQIASITSSNFGEYYDNFYLGGMGCPNGNIGILEIPCNAIGNSPVNEDSYSFTAEDMASGKLAADMNQVLGKNVYHQKLSDTKDAYPTTDCSRGSVIKAGDTYCNLDFATVETAATKLDGNGLRFTTAIKKADYNALLAAGIKESDVAFGTMITLKSYIEEASVEKMNFNMADFDTIGKAYINDTGVLTEQDGNFIFTGSVVRIPETNLEKIYCAVGYIRIGDTVYYSAEMAERSVSDVALAAYDDRTEVKNEEYTTVIAADSTYAIAGKASYSPYTEAQLAELKEKGMQK